jgi:hypothetical protein
VALDLISEWTVPTKVDLEFDYYVEPLLQARWITDGLRVAESLPSIHAVGWIHLYDEPPESHGGLLETDGMKKPGYAAWKRVERHRCLLAGEPLRMIDSSAS